MPSDAHAILMAALSLSEDERFDLVAKLLESMPAEQTLLSADDPNLIDELERRFADREGSVPWSELRDEE